jgi:hypothetical protein
VEKQFQERFLYLCSELRIMLVLFQKITKKKKRVIAHGILHLCGYKDKTEEQQKKCVQKKIFI